MLHLKVAMVQYYYYLQVQHHKLMWSLYLKANLIIFPQAYAPKYNSHNYLLF
jgi:hypothetical protein